MHVAQSRSPGRETVSLTSNTYRDSLKAIRLEAHELLGALLHNVLLQQTLGSHVTTGIARKREEPRAR